MTKIIAVLNQKGGVGKTTTTYNIASVLANEGNKVLMIDSDSQASLTLMMGIDPLSTDDNLAAIYDGVDINKCLSSSPIDNLDYIPSSLSLAKVETKLMSVMLGREFKLKKALEQLKQRYDYIFIDCPPTLGLLTINALIASGTVIAPCETTSLSIYALDDLIETIENIKEVNSKLKFLGVVAMKFVQNSNSHKKSLQELQERFNLLGIIRNSVSAQAGIDEGLPCVVSAPKSSVSIAYQEIVSKIKEEI